jgi:ubiquinone/menaquinone biosynthesis C-methylase UbiE
VEKATVGADESVEEVRVMPDNDEATEAWSGVLFDRFVEFRDLIVTGLEQHGRRAMSLYPPPAGARVLDVGCGFGDASQQLAELVGPEGEVIGVDVSQPFIDAATAEAWEAGAGNVSFRSGDVQLMDLGGPYDYVFSRMGIMFFANPVQALRNIASALGPGGRLVAVVWRRKLDNDWVRVPEQVVERYLEEPEEPEDVRCGPGPFSMANADTVCEQLQIAGFQSPTLTRLDLPMKVGDDLDQAVDFAMALGPAAELLRICPADQVDELRPKLAGEIREAIAGFETPEGVFGPTSTWIVSATIPE